MKKFFNTERLIALGCIALSIAIFFIAGTFPKTFLDPVGPSIYPQFLAVLIFVAGVLLFITAKEQPKEEKQEEGTGWHGYKPFVYTIVLIAVYLVLMPVLGFIVSTLLFTLALTLSFDQRPWKEKLKTAIPYSVVVTILVWLLFAKMLGVLLP